MKVILATAKQQIMEREWLPPLSLGYIAASLESKGIEVAIVDSEVNRYDSRMASEEILSYKPDAVGITATTNNRLEAIQLCNAIREKSNVLIFVGGPHFTPTARDALEKVKSIDVVVRREGEITTLEMLEAYNRKRGFYDIPGISFRGEDGKIVENAERPFIQDLDTIPMPAYHLFPLNKYNARLEGEYQSPNTIGVVSSRGCPYDCNFCANNALWRRSLRTRNPEKFVDEIEFLYDKYGYRSFDIWDDTMTIKKPHVKGICEEILRRKLDIKWYARSRVDSVNKEILGLMKEAGCVSMGFGVESGSPRILKSIQKGITIPVVKSIIKASADLGFYTKAFFILSLPGEEQEDVTASLSLIKELNSYGKNVMAGAGIAKIYPGTEMERIARSKEILPSGFSWNTECEFPINRLFNDIVSVPLFVQPQLPLEGLYVEIDRMQKRTWSDWFWLIIKSLIKMRNPRELKIRITKFNLIVLSKLRKLYTAKPY